MNHKCTVRFDSDKLERELHIRKVSKAEASRQIGYGETYLANAATRGTISEPAIKLLKTVYNIDFDSIKVDEPGEIIREKVIMQHPEIDYDKLNEILYDAVFRAVRDALKS